jgi:hypothetical protein
LLKGTYTATFDLISLSQNDNLNPIARIDVVGNNGRDLVVKLIEAKELRSKMNRFVLEFELDDTEFGIQLRCFSLGNGAFGCKWTPILA